MRGTKDRAGLILAMLLACFIFLTPPIAMATAAGAIPKSSLEIGTILPTDIASTHQLTDMLITRDLDTETHSVFNKAREVISKITPEQTCQAVAAFELFKACRSSKDEPIDDTESKAKMELGKSLYGIRLGLCETQAANAEVPKPCQRLQSFPSQSRGFFGIRSRDGNDFTSKQVSKCLEILQSKHYYWTSYSNNRQNAEALCTASSHDMAQMQMLEIYSQLANIIPDFRDALSGMRKELLQTAMDQRGYATEMEQFHKDNRQDLMDSHAAAVNALYQIRTNAELDVKAMSSTLIQSLRDSEGQAIGIDKALHLFSHDLEELSHQMTKQMKQASSGYGDLVILQEKSFRDIHEMAIEAVQQVALQQQSLSAASRGLVQHLQHLSDSFPGVVHDISLLQQEQLSRAQQQLDIQSKTVEKSLAISHLSEQHRQELDKAVLESSSINELLVQMTERSKQINGSLGGLAILLAGISWINSQTLAILSLLYLMVRFYGLNRSTVPIIGLLWIWCCGKLFMQYSFVNSLNDLDLLRFDFYSSLSLSTVGYVSVIALSSCVLMIALHSYIKQRDVKPAEFSGNIDHGDKDDDDYCPPESDEESDIFDDYLSEYDEEKYCFRREYTAPL